MGHLFRMRSSDVGDTPKCWGSLCGHFCCKKVMKLNIAARYKYADSSVFWFCFFIHLPPLLMSPPPPPLCALPSERELSSHSAARLSVGPEPPATREAEPRWCVRKPKEAPDIWCLPAGQRPVLYLVTEGGSERADHHYLLVYVRVWFLYLEVDPLFKAKIYIYITTDWM